MLRIYHRWIFVCLIILVSLVSCGESVERREIPFGIVIHGGAGTIREADMTDEKEQAYRAKLHEALEAGYTILAGDGTSLDAIEAAIRVMENSPLFNAGKGAVFTAEGTNELDASIMEGKSLNAGAVAGVRHIKNPITAARKVMEESRHVMLAGEGADTFARQQGLNMVSQDYFFTRRRWESLMKRKGKAREKEGEADTVRNEHGTVGAVALDTEGNLAAGTSTGGLTYKQFGRIGDSPVIGAGTYADNGTCAISSTGHGEYFIRLAVAHRISALMAYREISLEQAAQQVIREDLVELGGSGGVIGIDADGDVTMQFTTPGMYRGYRLGNREPVVRFYEEME